MMPLVPRVAHNEAVIKFVRKYREAKKAHDDEQTGPHRALESPKSELRLAEGTRSSQVLTLMNWRLGCCGAGS